MISHEPYLSLVLEHMTQGCLSFDRTLTVLPGSNPACKRLLACEPEGMPVTRFIYVEPTGEVMLQQQLDEIFASTNPQYREDLLRNLPYRVCVNGKHLYLEFKYLSRQATGDEPFILLLLTEQLETEAKPSLEYLSYHDSLTGTFNRAYLEKMLPELPRPLSVMMVDMNGLKLINDVFGHDQGDQLLLRACETFRKCLRSSDIIVRWGGDEFILLLPSAGEKACRILETRLEKACIASAAEPIKISIACGTTILDDYQDNFHEKIKLAEYQMYKKKLTSSKLLRHQMFNEIEQVMYDRGLEQPEHINRVMKLSEQFAKKLGLQETKSKQLGMLARLHDVGRLGIPAELLYKPSQLKDLDWEEMKTHSEIGYRLAQSLGEPMLADHILGLHEWWDGSGYPHGAKGEDIPFISRVFSIIDVYDVLTHDQCYRPAMSSREALKTITAHTARQFDPTLVLKFLRFMDEEKDHKRGKE